MNTGQDLAAAAPFSMPPMPADAHKWASESCPALGLTVGIAAIINLAQLAATYKGLRSGGGALAS